MKVINKDYKQKYAKLKSRVKNYVLENASIVDEICYSQAELTAARAERLVLIERLMFHEGLDKSVNSQLSSNESRDPVKKNEKQNGVVEERNKIKFKESSKQQQKTSMFPIKLNNILIHALGEIIPANPNFHTAHCIYPVGYVATRIYAHPKDPRKKCVFTCKILNNAGVPQFQLIPDNDLDGVFFGETANTCHQELLNCIQGFVKESINVTLKAQGDVFFGLSNPKIQSLLMSDKKVEQCTKFKGYILSNNSIMDNDPTISYAELQNYLG